jgi:mono/diheme cytochrome c family protein
VRSKWTGWPVGSLPPVPEGVVLSSRAEEGRQLFARSGCSTCHAIGGQGRSVAVDFAAVKELKSRQVYRAYILHPPEGIAMPSYAGRLQEDELESLLDYVHAAQNFSRQVSR